MMPRTISGSPAPAELTVHPPGAAIWPPGRFGMNTSMATPRITIAIPVHVRMGMLPLTRNPIEID
jgi:hypothetical protein